MHVLWLADRYGHQGAQRPRKFLHRIHMALFANGALIWLVVCGIWIQIKLGSDSANALIKRWYIQYGLFNTTVRVIGWGAVASLSAGVIGGIVQHSIFRVFAGTLLCYLAGSYLQQQIYGFSSGGWIIVAICSTIVTIRLSAYMIERDKKQREKIRDTT
jgi:hypothetical protein